MHSDSPIRQRNMRKILTIVLFIALVTVFIYLYVEQPFPNGVTDLVTSAMIAGAAIAAAAISTHVWMYYGRSSPPRRVWRYFMIALWGWAAAEVVWLVLYIVDGDYTFGPADALWVSSYLFFMMAVFSQYVLIYRPSARIRYIYLALAFAAVLLFTYLYGSWLLSVSSNADRLETFVIAFYAVGDLSLALAAMLLAYAFRNGALGRPWLGLIVFAFSDLLYAWLESSGLYAWSVAEGNILTTITDTTYFAAYLIIAIGCYVQWILLTFGPRLKNET